MTTTDTPLLTKQLLKELAKQRTKVLPVADLGNLLIRKLNAREVRDLAKKGKELATDDDEETSFAVGVLCDAVITKEGNPFFDSPAEVFEILGLDDIEYVMEQILSYSGCGGNKEQKNDSVKNSDAPAASV